MTGYYDFVLGVIPVALLGITGVLSVAGLSLTAAVPVGSIAAIGVMGHAMFVNSPVDDTRPVDHTSEGTDSAPRSVAPRHAD